jgi:hypothetical protein
MKYVKKIHTIVCDDIREEKNNKFSLMGIYGKEIVFNKLPALLPKLCIIIMLEEVREKFAKIEITMKLPKTKPQVFNRQVPSNVALKSDFNFIFCLSPFKVEETGEAIFEVRIGESKRTNYVYRLKINERKIS